MSSAKGEALPNRRATGQWIKLKRNGDGEEDNGEGSSGLFKLCCTDPNEDLRSLRREREECSERITESVEVPSLVAATDDLPANERTSSESAVACAGTDGLTLGGALPRANDLGKEPRELHRTALNPPRVRLPSAAQESLQRAL